MWFCVFVEEVYFDLEFVEKWFNFVVVEVICYYMEVVESC